LDFGISKNASLRWMIQADMADGTAVGLSDDGSDDVVALRRRLRPLEQRNEVLRRVAADLIGGHQPK